MPPQKAQPKDDKQAIQDIIGALRSRVRKIMPVSLPGFDLPMGIVILNQEEMHQAHLRTQEAFGKYGDAVALMDAWQAELARQILSYAVVHPKHIDDQVIRVFKSPEELREVLSGPEVDWLMNQYNQHPDSKFWDSLTQEDTGSSVIDELATNPTTGQSGSGSV